MTTPARGPLVIAVCGTRDVRVAGALREQIAKRYGRLPLARALAEELASLHVPHYVDARELEFPILSLGLVQARLASPFEALVLGTHQTPPHEDDTWGLADIVTRWLELTEGVAARPVKVEANPTLLEPLVRELGEKLAPMVRAAVRAHRRVVYLRAGGTPDLALAIQIVLAGLAPTRPPEVRAVLDPFYLRGKPPPGALPRDRGIGGIAASVRPSAALSIAAGLGRFSAALELLEPRDAVHAAGIEMAQWLATPHRARPSPACCELACSALWPPLDERIRRSLAADTRALAVSSEVAWIRAALAGDPTVDWDVAINRAAALAKALKVDDHKSTSWLRALRNRSWLAHGQDRPSAAAIGHQIESVLLELERRAGRSPLPELMECLLRPAKGPGAGAEVPVGARVLIAAAAMLAPAAREDVVGWAERAGDHDVDAVLDDLDGLLGEGPGAGRSPIALIGVDQGGGDRRDTAPLARRLAARLRARGIPAEALVIAANPADAQACEIELADRLPSLIGAAPAVAVLEAGGALGLRHAMLCASLDLAAKAGASVTVRRRLRDGGAVALPFDRLIPAVVERGLDAELVEARDPEALRALQPREGTRTEPDLLDACLALRRGTIADRELVLAQRSCSQAKWAGASREQVLTAARMADVRWELKRGDPNVAAARARDLHRRLVLSVLSPDTRLHRSIADLHGGPKPPYAQVRCGDPGPLLDAWSEKGLYDGALEIARCEDPGCAFARVRDLLGPQAQSIAAFDRSFHGTRISFAYKTRLDKEPGEARGKLIDSLARSLPCDHEEAFDRYEERLRELADVPDLGDPISDLLHAREPDLGRRKPGVVGL